MVLLFIEQDTKPGIFRQRFPVTLHNLLILKILAKLQSNYVESYEEKMLIYSQTHQNSSQKNMEQYIPSPELSNKIMICNKVIC